MRGSQTKRPFTRRGFLGGVGCSALLASLGKARFAEAACSAGMSTPCQIRLGATDGHFVLPGRNNTDLTDPVAEAGPLFGFGFVQGDPFNAPIMDLIAEHKGLVQWPSPTIAVDEDDVVFLTMTNLGFQYRPDLDDAHTIHWHGFRNPVAYFDGVPEASISVPPGRDFEYFYPPRLPGTYMYHCHFEDVEHVQLGMDGNVFVRPRQNKTGASGAPITRLGGNPGSSVLGYAYNDDVAVTDPRSTAYDREFALLLNEIDTRPHDLLLAVQEFVWSDYKANYWVINGRSYPHTIIRNGDVAGESDLLVAQDPFEPVSIDNPATIRQPVSSLIQVNAGDRVLLRFANLGYEQQSMQLPGIPMRVVGEDATFLQGPAGDDLSYLANTIYIGPGEARDVLITAPTFSGGGEPDPLRGVNYDRYVLKNRNVHSLHNDGITTNGLGGQVTEVWVYNGTLPDQAVPNETYV